MSKWAIKRILHTKNIRVNSLAGIVATFPIKEVVLPPVYFQAALSIIVAPVCNASETDINWMHEIEAYIWIGKLLEESKQAHKIRIQTACFILIEDNPYR